MPIPELDGERLVLHGWTRERTPPDHKRLTNLAVVSLFRDSMWYLHQHCLPQLERLCREWPGDVRCYFTEGDSVDETASELETWAKVTEMQVRLFKVNGGYRKFGSTENPLRYKVLAACANAALEGIAEDRWADLVWYVDSDYRWTPKTPIRLADHQLPAVAPYSLAYSRVNGGAFFYDTWGYSYRGRPFRRWGPPYHPFMQGRNVHPLDTAGASVMVDAKFVYGGLRFTDEECIRGFTRQVAQAKGLWADPQARIWHLYPWSVKNVCS